MNRVRRKAEGFIYVADEHVEGDELMKLAREGEVVRIEGRGPPWIVVHHALETITISKWPGRLWRVRIIEAATTRDQSKVGTPLADAGYTRSISVRILNEISPDALFGPRGSDVAAVLKKASQLDRSVAKALASSQHPDASRAYDRVWRAWLKDRGLHDDQDLDGTVQFAGKTLSGSPINKGLLVLHYIVFKRARALDGTAVIQTDGEDETLAPPWNGAASALGDAALAFGAPELATDSEKAVLLQAWRLTFD
jgi:hypothetical protein